MEKITEILLEYGVEHPARVMDFTELTHGLFAEVDKGLIDVNYHPEIPHLAIFKYTQECVVDRHWNKFTAMARGLILDLKNKVVVATPFVKFFNYGEIDHKPIIQPEFTVMEKVDGSLGIMFCYEDQWMVSTAGSFSSDQAHWANKWMFANMPLDKIDKNNTYLFEIIYFENRIVVRYGYEGLVLLAIVDSYGLEYTYEQLMLEATYMETRCAKQYDFKDMDSILNRAKELGIDDEGYVIRFKNGVRLKIKGDEYVRVHRLMCKVTPLAIWRSLGTGEDVEELKYSLPEEMERDFHLIVAILEGQLSDFVKEVERLFEKSTAWQSDKEFALYVKENPDEFKSDKFNAASNYIFMMRKCSFYKAVRSCDSYTRESVFKSFRPTLNRLKGYKPSVAVSMFTCNNNGDDV